MDPNSLSANFVDVFLEVASLLKYRVEQTVILNRITKEKNKDLEDDKKTIKFHRLERSMEESLSKLKSVVD